MLAQRCDQRLPDCERTVQYHPPAALTGALGRRGGEQRLFGLRAKALERADPLLLCRAAKRLQRVHAQLLEQPPCALRSEAREPRDLDQPGREFRPQLHRRGNHPIGGEREDFLLDRLTDPGELGRASLARQRGHRDGRVADRLGGVAVRDDPVDDRAVELIQVTELVERGGYLGIGRLARRGRVARWGCGDRVLVGHLQAARVWLEGYSARCARHAILSEVLSMLFDKEPSMAGTVAEVTDTNFQAEVIESEVPVLVDFWAPWCGPCRMVAPVVEEIAQERGEQLKVVKLNIDENQNTAVQFNVLSIPTLILFRNGEVAKTVVGAYPKRKLEAELEPALA
jgi:thioredoxin 1